MVCAQAIEAAAALGSYHDARPARSAEPEATESGWQPRAFVADAPEATTASAAAASAVEAPPGFTFDEASGYYHDAESGYYYDAASQLYYHPTTAAWYRHNEATGEYDVIPAAADDAAAAAPAAGAQVRVRGVLRLRIFAVARRHVPWRGGAAALKQRLCSSTVQSAGMTTTETQTYGALWRVRFSRGFL